jgi:hypothetical protein
MVTLFAVTIGCAGPVLRVGVRVETDEFANPVSKLHIDQITDEGETAKRYSKALRHHIHKRLLPYIDQGSENALSVPWIKYEKTRKRDSEGAEYVNAFFELKAEIRNDLGAKQWEGAVYLDMDIKPMAEREIDRIVFEKAAEKLEKILPLSRK